MGVRHPSGGDGSGLPGGKGKSRVDLTGPGRFPDAGQRAKPMTDAFEPPEIAAARHARAAGRQTEASVRDWPKTHATPRA